MTERYERELFGLRCGDLIETIGAVLKFGLEDWQRHRLETLRAELIGNKGVLSDDHAVTGVEQNGRAE